MKMIDIPLTSLFQKGIDQARELVGGRGMFLVLLVGAKKPETGQSWCPDCILAEPAVYDAITEYERNTGQELVLVQADCKREEYKNNPLFPYRTHPQLLVQSIPSLYKWNAETDQTVKLTEEFTTNKYKIIDFLFATNNPPQ